MYKAFHQLARLSRLVIVLFSDLKNIQTPTSEAVIALMTLVSAPPEVLLDPCRTWCPSSTCQAVCQLKESDSPALPQLVQCAVCALEFCSACKANWHPGQACQENNLPTASFLPGENRYCSAPIYICFF